MTSFWAYIAQSWNAARDTLARAIQLEPGASARKSLMHLGEERGEPVEGLTRSSVSGA